MFFKSLPGLLAIISITSAHNSTWHSVIRQHCHTLPDQDPPVVPPLIPIPDGPRGPPGIPGNPGKSGRRGPPGPPAMLDRTRMDEIFQDSLASVSQLYPNLRVAEIPEDYDAKLAYESTKPKPIYREWTVFQRRTNRDISFYRVWDEYVIGFGTTNGDFWLGLEDIHQQTRFGYYELKIDMIALNGTFLTAHYGSFKISPASDKYRLQVSGYSGNATDALSYHSGSQFSTLDADHDSKTQRNCAKNNKGAWWYNRCQLSNLNGRFKDHRSRGLRWSDMDAKANIPLRFTEMSFRQVL